ncbi:L-fucose kinase [Patella vulgata]|uniref:L-fucose kinase n=1 Tax=Patella vulgata TaxID=6465 RepID=UPI00217F4D50|nr:L-fucose kinase [Patella vulgata]XP_050398759.1 L-fucose kinase [Patella vulgata]
MKSTAKWTAIVVTCSNKAVTPSLQQALELRQSKGYINEEAILLTVEDPKDNVGSGGATINALLTVIEYISAKKGYTVINPDVLKDALILILHVGRSYCYDTTTRPFITLPAEYVAPEYDGLVYNLDFIIRIIGERFAVKSGPGVWISSTEYILSMPEGTDIPWKECEVACVTVPSTMKFCKDHGVYKVDKEGIVQDILYQKGADELGPCQRRDGSVPVAVGLVYLNRNVAEKLLSFYIKPPLDACCYMGIDNGQPPINLSLFFDVLLPMLTDITEEDFVAGNRSASYGKPPPAVDESTACMRQARRILWRELHGYRVQSCMIESGSFHYLNNSVTEYKKCQQDSPFKSYNFKDVVWKNIVHSAIEPKSTRLSDESIVINSSVRRNVCIGNKTIVSHSCLHGRIDIARDCIISGVKIENVKDDETVEIAEDIVLQGFNIKLKTFPVKQNVFTVHGRFDNIKAPTWKTTSTFCNTPWLLFLNRTGILREDLWGTEVDNDDQTFLTAKLFPVFHATSPVGLKEILWMQGTVNDDEQKTILKRWRSSWRLSFEEILAFTDSEKEFQYKKDLFYEVGGYQIEQALNNQENVGFRKLYNTASREGYTQAIFNILDKVASKTDSPGVAARTLANIGDLLGSMAENKGGLRSGPAANNAWRKAFQLLEDDQLEAGVEALATVRTKWLNRPDLLVRAARHYEGAAQILIRKAVMTAKKYMDHNKADVPMIGQWVRADCPARIDLAGGWSDTPPITYEHGGAVTIAALLINGKRPIGARVRRTEEPVIKLEIVGAQGDKNTVVCSELSHLKDYCQPHAAGALLKSAFICTDVIDLNSNISLSEQLKTNYGGGFEMQSWSNLPQGSGLGTSSILAGAVIGALLRAAGKCCTSNSLVHAVLYLEQLLTTGGGWQDQVGGLMGGFQFGYSDAKLPLEVKTVPIEVAPETVTAFNKRLCLIYTGKTRLARNLLQDVIRNWYARNPYIVQTEDLLVSIAGDCKDALMKGDLDKTGQIIDKYWELKKRMAPGSEPDRVTELISLLRPHVNGVTLAGAGGGGFMFVLMKEETSQDLIRKLFSKKGLEDVEIYDAELDNQGLTVYFETD